GWWLIEIEAIFGKKGRHLPLWLELFSVARRGYKSQRTLVQKAIGELVSHIGRWGLWVFDRGFDNWQFFAFLGTLCLEFLIRVKGNRCVIDLVDGRRKSLAVLAREVLTKTPFVWSRRHKGAGYLMHLGYAPIQIPQSGQRLFLIVVRGFGKHSMLLLTSRSVSEPQAALALVRAYLKRWGVEEAGRLVKQAFDLENLRVLSWQGLVKLVWLALWTYGLLCLIRIKAGKLYRQILSLYPSFGPVPRFPYYRLAGGLAWALFVGVLTNPSLFFTLQKSG
ncbi:MAG: transposase, partial [candidate division Zixibacteria bacterium]|nr:transposase [candidate division Zixibacteria bacterium]